MVLDVVVGPDNGYFFGTRRTGANIGSHGRGNAYLSETDLQQPKKYGSMKYPIVGAQQYE